MQDYISVLIPLLLDDPLWASLPIDVVYYVKLVLIPLLLDDPLWDFVLQKVISTLKVLIPLLLDDPLWVNIN